MKFIKSVRSAMKPMSKVDRAADLADVITIAMPATTGDPATSEPGALVHLTFAPGRQAENDLTLRLTDMDGAPLPADPEPRVTAEMTSLDHAVTRPGIVLEASDPATQTYGLSGLNLTIDGWWRIRATIRRPFMDDLTADFYLLIPDPNINGFGAPPRPGTDQEANTLLGDAMATMRAWTSVRWWQALSGGNDSLVIAEYAVTTTAANGQPDAFMSRTRYAAGFEPRADGSPPDPPARDSFTTVTIGDQGWNIDADGAVTPQGPVQYLPIDQYPETYQGAEHVRLGGVEDVDGEEARIVTFHTPEQPTQAEAWFALWIGTESGNVVRLAMVARNHYMVWEYSDIDAGFTIDLPASGARAATPVASPVASPAIPEATPHQH
jgi:hypothetical protein